MFGQQSARNFKITNKCKDLKAEARWQVHENMTMLLKCLLKG